MLTWASTFQRARFTRLMSALNLIMEGGCKAEDRRFVGSEEIDDPDVLDNK